MAKMRKGLLGGTFDPPHRAHVTLARTALSELKLDALKVIPAGDPWQRSIQPSPAHDRWAMCQLAFAGLPGVELDDLEIRRSRPSYTLETVQELKQAEPQTDWYLIIGSDQASRFHTWHQWQELLKLVQLVVAQRPGSSSQWQNDKLSQAISLPFEPLDLSSTQIRALLAQRKEVAHMDPQVLRYIQQHQLYAPTPHD